MGQRDTIKVISPPWLQTGTAEKYMYTLGLMSDLLLEKLNQGMKAHMPTLADPTALPYIGNDRVMPQGPNEPNDAYAIRLQKAYETWQHAGERRSILEELFPFYEQSYELDLAPGQYPLALIVGGNYAYSTWDTFYNTSDPTQPPAHVRKSEPINWNWDKYTSYQDMYNNTVTRWWRAWLVVFFTQVPLNVSGLAATHSGPSGGFVTLTGLNNITGSMVGQYVTIANSASPAQDNGTFQITATPSSASIIYANNQSDGTDAHNGAIHWSIVEYPTIGPAPVFGAPGAVIGPTCTDAMTGQWNPTGGPTGIPISIGLSIPPGIVNGMRGILRTWKSAATYYPNIIISFGGADGRPGSDFSPNSVQGDGNPDGTWGSWAKLDTDTGSPTYGRLIQSRITGTPLGKFNAFCDGSGVYQMCFEPTGT